MFRGQVVQGIGFAGWKSLGCGRPVLLVARLQREDDLLGTARGRAGRSEPEEDDGRNSDGGTGHSDHLPAYDPTATASHLTSDSIV
jgi:hypothetical protein